MELLRGLKSQVPRKRFRVLMLRFGHDLSQHEIARKLNKSRRTVRWHLETSYEQFPHLHRILTTGRHRRRQVDY